MENTKKMKQRSDEWFELRRGKATASMFKVIMAVRGLGKTAQDYALEVAGHELIEVFEEAHQSYAMKKGAELEPYAAEAYELETLTETSEIAFVTNPVIPSIGGSPDRLVLGGKGGIEIKCPEQKKHLFNLEAEDCPKEYVDQIQGLLLITGREWWDFVSYNPNFKEEYRLKIIRVLPDLEWQEKFKLRLTEFNSLVEKYKTKFNK